MKYRKLGNTGEKLSSIGLGCMGMSHAYGNGDKRESIATLHRALDLGINFWDTADFYGNGENERLLSRVLKENRDEIFVATKFGFKFTPGQSHFATTFDGSPQWMKQAIEFSLKRLKVDYIDLYYAHRIDPNIPIEEMVGAMADLVKEGKVRYLGLCEASAITLRKAYLIHPIAALQSEYSLLTRDIEQEIYPTAKELGITIVPFSPLGRGMFTDNFDIDKIEKGDARLELPRFQKEHLINNQNLIKELSLFAKSKGTNVATIAIAWILAKGEDIIPIPGTKKRKYLETNALAVNINLSNNEIMEIENIIAKYPNTGERYTKEGQKLIDK